jgi:hypothetical protein
MQTQEDLPFNMNGHDKINDIKKYWNGLVNRHRRLDDEIKEGYDAYKSDQFIKSLKLNKLHIKQEIEIIKTEMVNLAESISRY